MTTAVAAADTDLRALGRLIEDARHDDPGEVVPWALLDGLLRLIPADSVQLTETDWVHQSVVLQQAAVQAGERAVAFAVGDDDATAYFRHCRTFRPCGDPMRPDELLDAIRWSDYYTDQELLKTEAYVEYFSYDSARAALSVRLPSVPGHALRVVFMRSTFFHFTDRDVLLLSLLRPHLHAIYLDAERRRHGPPKLTSREWEILQFAGEGLSNGAIAERLVISPATVRKHIEHILDTLGVHSRTEAAAAALPHLAGGTTVRG